jgi:PAS domain S-box-containing protein
VGQRVGVAARRRSGGATVLHLADRGRHRRSGDRRAASSQCGAVAATFEHTPAGFALRDLDRRYEHANSYIAAALGTTPADVIGRLPEELLAPEALARVRLQDEQLLRSGSPITEEVQVRLGTGEPLPLQGATASHAVGDSRRTPGRRPHGTGPSRPAPCRPVVKPVATTRSARYRLTITIPVGSGSDFHDEPGNLDRCLDRAAVTTRPWPHARALHALSRAWSDTIWRCWQNRTPMTQPRHSTSGQHEPAIDVVCLSGDPGRVFGEEKRDERRDVLGLA